MLYRYFFCLSAMLENIKIVLNSKSKEMIILEVYIYFFFSIELFQKMCDELKDWIGEKTSGINLDDVGKDLASVQALQRKHQNLEQELRPIEDKLNKMNMIGKCVSVCRLLPFFETRTSTECSAVFWCRVIKYRF
jgi:hypothetical protein